MFANVANPIGSEQASVWEFRYAPGQSIPTHQHATAYVCFLLSGDILETRETETRSYARDRLVYLPKGDRHSAIIGPSGAHAIGVEIRDSLLTEGDRLKALPKESTKLNDARLRLLLHHAVLAARWGEATFEITTLPYAIVGELMNEPKEESARWIRTLAEFIDAHSYEPLQIRTLSRLAGRHPSHMMRAFRAQTGVTIGDYYRKSKVERATRLLRESDGSLTHIAADCGFSDLSHFGRLFRREYGLSPQDFRRVIAA